MFQRLVACTALAIGTIAEVRSCGISSNEQVRHVCRLPQLECVHHVCCMNTGRIKSNDDDGVRRRGKCFMRETDFKNFRERYAVNGGDVRNSREWARAVSSEPILAGGLGSPREAIREDRRRTAVPPCCFFGEI